MPDRVFGKYNMYLSWNLSHLSRPVVHVEVLANGTSIVFRHYILHRDGNLYTGCSGEYVGFWENVLGPLCREESRRTGMVALTERVRHDPR